MGAHHETAPRRASTPWQFRAACRGLGPERWYPETRADQTHEARAICATCPVVAPCLETALDPLDDFGIWGGTGEPERRHFARLRRDRTHGPDVVVGCRCAWCAELRRHLAKLATPAGGPRRTGRAGNHNGPNATHGRRSTYARGCRCDPCRWSASKIGVAVARAGHQTADVWAAHVGAGTDWPEARDLADAAARALLGAAGGATDPAP